MEQIKKFKMVYFDFLYDRLEVKVFQGTQDRLDKIHDCMLFSQRYLVRSFEEIT